MKSFSVNINGERWKYKLLEDSRYNKVMDEKDESDACTFKRRREMLFRRSALKFGTVIHELIHAYCYYLYLNSADISKEDYEEIICELMEDRMMTIVDQAHMMYLKMKGRSYDKGTILKLSQEFLRPNVRDRKEQKR